MKLSTAIATTIALCASTVQSQQYSVFHLKFGTKCTKPSGAGGEFFNAPADQWGGLVAGDESDCNKVYFTANTLSGKIGVVPQVGEEFKMMYLAFPYDNPTAANPSVQNYLCGHEQDLKTFKVVRLGPNKVNGINCSPLTFTREADGVIKVKRSDPITGRGSDAEGFCMYLPGVYNGKNMNILAYRCNGGVPLKISDAAKTVTSPGNLGLNYDRFASTEYVLYDVVGKQFVTIGAGDTLQRTTDKNAATIFSTVTKDVEKANLGFVAICASGNRCIRHFNYRLYIQQLNTGNRQDFSWKVNDNSGLKTFTNAINTAWSIRIDGDIRGNPTNFAMVPKGLLGENSYAQIVLSESSSNPSRVFCFDVFSSQTNNGAAVGVGICQAPSAQWGNQLFKYDDKQRLVSRHSGKCLQVTGTTTTVPKSTVVVLGDCTDSDIQKFIYDNQGRIQPKNLPGKSLADYEDPAKPWSESRVLEFSSFASSYVFSEDKTFVILNPMNQFLLAVGALPIKSSINAPNGLFANVEGWIGNPAEYGKILLASKTSGAGFYLDRKQRLVNAVTQKCLDFDYYTFAVQQETCVDNDQSQKWFYDSKDRLRSFKTPWRCMEGSSTAMTLKTSECTDDPKFKFTRL